MVEGKATLVVDLGNSETRVKTKKGKSEVLTILDNGYSEMDYSDVAALVSNGEYTGMNSRIFYMNGDLYCNGLVCEREYFSTRFRPTSADKKHSSITTKVTLRNALRQGYEDLAKMTGCEIDAIDVVWDVVVLMPPEDLESLVPIQRDENGNTVKEITGWQKMSQTVKEITSINFLLPDMKKDIKIDQVKVLPEGFCALLAVIFEKKGKLRPEYTYLTDKDNTTIIFDIGAGTTDIVLAVGGKVISRSRTTVAVGGNNVVQSTRKYLKKNNINLRDDAITRGCEEGFVKSGEKTFNIVSQVNRIKKQVATILIESVNQYFEQNNLSINSITNMLVCGGGAETPSNADIHPMSMYLVKKLTERSGNSIGMVKIPEEEHYGPHGKEIKTMSPRLLNIIGAGIAAD